MLYFEIFPFLLQFGSEKSAQELSFHLKNSPKIPLWRLSPFPIEAGACPPGHSKLKGSLKRALLTASGG